MPRGGKGGGRGSGKGGGKRSERDGGIGSKGSTGKGGSGKSKGGKSVGKGGKENSKSDQKGAGKAGGKSDGLTRKQRKKSSTSLRRTGGEAPTKKKVHGIARQDKAATAGEGASKTHRKRKRSKGKVASVPAMPAPNCRNGHTMESRSENPASYKHYACCDVCGMENLPKRVQTFFHCRFCRFDMCPKCAREGKLQKADDNTSDDEPEKARTETLLQRARDKKAVHEGTKTSGKKSKGQSADKKAYSIGDRVRVRDRGEAWKVGFVTKTRPLLKVKVDGFEDGCTWDEVEPLQAQPSKNSTVLEAQIPQEFNRARREVWIPTDTDAVSRAPMKATIQTDWVEGVPL